MSAPKPKMLTYQDRLSNVAREVFDSPQEADCWLQAPNSALEGKDPIHFASSEQELGKVDSILKLIARAKDVFGSSQKAERWVREPNPALDWKEPIHFAASKKDFDKVAAILVRIEYGVPS